MLHTNVLNIALGAAVDCSHGQIDSCQADHEEEVSGKEVPAILFPRYDGSNIDEEVIRVMNEIVTKSVKLVADNEVAYGKQTYYHNHQASGDGFGLQGEIEPFANTNMCMDNEIITPESRSLGDIDMLPRSSIIVSLENNNNNSSSREIDIDINTRLIEERERSHKFEKHIIDILTT